MISAVKGVPDGEQQPDEHGGPLSAGMTAIRGARSELRRQMREQRRLRMGVLIMVSLLVLGALPLYFGIRAATRDPVFNGLDALAVPGWAATKTHDEVSGSRWCLVDCRLRERTISSERGPDETAQVYEQAISRAGWRRWKAPLCPQQPVAGHYSCWRRDELTLDLWVRPPVCTDGPAKHHATAEPTGAPGDPAATARCSGSQVSVKVRNAIDDDRVKPQPSTDPSLTGEDPDPVFTDDPLLDPTPLPS